MQSTVAHAEEVPRRGELLRIPNDFVAKINKYQSSKIRDPKNLFASSDIGKQQSSSGKPNTIPCERHYRT
jgi:hypothetical protein